MLTDQEFNIFQSELKERSGITIEKDKLYLLESRLMPVAKKHGLEDLSALAQHISAPAGSAVINEVVEAMTTNETSFMRDSKPFKRFRELILPDLMENKKNGRTIRIWCAACSSGQEPYSLAIILDEMKEKLTGWTVEILATDISEEMVERAKAGVYTQFEVQRGLSVQHLVKYFTQEEEKWIINPALKTPITFNTFNLLDSYRQHGKFDIIFCRNVLIYFEKELKINILDRMSEVINPDGYLLLGGAETVLGLTEHWKPVPGFNGIYIDGESDPKAKSEQFMALAAE